MFDSVSELTEKIALGEDSTIEFKRQLTDKKKLADEIVAFANTSGGVILIGVDNNSTIFGINRQDLDRTEETVMEICWDIIHPKVFIVTDKRRIDDKNLLKIDVPRSQYVHRSSNGYFVRHGSSKRKMSTEQSVRSFLNSLPGNRIPFDEQSLPNTHKDTLKETLYQRFITEGATDREKIEDLLHKRHLLVQEGQKYRASVAGVLMCHDKPDEYIYNSYIQAVYYSGKAKDANYQIDAKDFRGPLDQQIVDAFNFVDRYNLVSTRKEISGVGRPKYSMRAIFEAVVNAVVHRDYSKPGARVRLFMFADRLELYSPGALAETLKVADLPYHQVTRNELLASLLSALTFNDDVGIQVVRRRFLECRGEGVGVILNESEKLSGKTPIYKLSGEELRLTIFAAKS